MPSRVTRSYQYQELPDDFQADIAWYASRRPGLRSGVNVRACASALAACDWFNPDLAFKSRDAVPATSGELKAVPDAAAYPPPGNLLRQYSPGEASQKSDVPHS